MMVDKVSYTIDHRVTPLIGAFVLGWAACSSYYRIEHLWQEQNTLVHVEKVVVPSLVKHAECEHRARDIAVKGLPQELPSCPEPKK